MGGATLQTQAQGLDPRPVVFVGFSFPKYFRGVAGLIRLMLDSRLRFWGLGLGGIGGHGL